MKRAPAPRKALDGVHPYREASAAPLNLSNNTSLFEPNPAFAQALQTFPPEQLAAYPSLDSRRLREAAATAHSLRPEMVVTGNGSNDLLDLAMRAFCEPGERVAWHPPSFEMVPVFARAAGCDVRDIALRQPGFTLDAVAMLAARAKVAVICRPNNPTGNAFPHEDVLRVVEESAGLVVVDEAYGDFADDSFVPLVKEHPNLLVTRTLSKAHGLAALRIGYGLAQAPVIEALYKARGPFRLNALSEHLGVAALQDTNYVRKVVDEVRRERAHLTTELRTRGITVQESDANFVLFKPACDAKLLHAALLRRGVGVRVFAAPGLKGWVRTTVGPAWVTRRFLADLDAALREVGR